PARVLVRARTEHHPVGHRALHDQRSVRDRALRAVQVGHWQRDGHRRHLHGHLLPELPWPVRKGRRGSNLEPDDSPCFKFGDTHGGTAAPNLVTGCDVFLDAVGDLDWDGTSYYPDWPDSVVPDRFPSTFLQLQPTTVGGHRYPQIQFMTDTSASELNTNCDLNSGAGCVLPPQGPGHFFPYFTQ